MRDPSRSRPAAASPAIFTDMSDPPNHALTPERGAPPAGTARETEEETMIRDLARRGTIAGFALALTAGSAFALDPTPKWCEGVKIAAFPGGPQGGVFANNVYNGFLQPRRISGRRSPTISRTGIRTRCSPRSSRRSATQVDGIATYGFAGEPRDRPGRRSGLQAGHHLHHAQHLAARQPEEIRRRRASATSARRNYAAGQATRRRGGRTPDAQRKGDKVFVWGLQGPEAATAANERVGIDRRLRPRPAPR